MKKLFLALALLCTCAIGANAQFSSLTFNNNSSCTIYVQIVGTTAGSGCSTDYGTPVFIGIPPGVTTYNDPSMVTPLLNDGFGNTLGSSDHFTLIKFCSSDPAGSMSCTPFNTFVMSNCTGWPAVTSMMGFNFDDSNTCATCGTYNITLTVGGGMGTVDIM